MKIKNVIDGWNVRTFGLKEGQEDESSFGL
jgi:hypothetical protein